MGAEIAGLSGAHAALHKLPPSSASPPAGEQAVLSHGSAYSIEYIIF
jgi:hypothetical protein